MVFTGLYLHRKNKSLVTVQSCVVVFKRQTTALEISEIIFGRTGLFEDYGTNGD